eukprot:7136892-Pyramimonas_sp.AAC.1
MAFQSSLYTSAVLCTCGQGSSSTHDQQPPLAVPSPADSTAQRPLSGLSPSHSLGMFGIVAGLGPRVTGLRRSG